MRPEIPATLDDRQFSYIGSSLALLGNAIALPADWSPAVRTLLSFLGALFVGVIVPMGQRALRDWIEFKAGVRRAEKRALKAEAELAYYKASHEGLTPVPPEITESTGDWTPPKGA
jgi:hypothetical protein